MTSDDDNPDLPDFPEKLADRIDALPPELDEGDTIVGNGDVELTSEHPISVVEYYLIVHTESWAEWTYLDNSYDLTRFLEYCEYAELDDLSDLSSRDVTGFKEWRERDGNIGLATLHGQLANIRSFIRWCERVEIVEEGLADEIEMPDLDDDDIVSYVRLDSDVGDKIIEYYEQKDHVPREFAEFVLMWVGLCRLGDVRSLDLEDYNREEGYIEINHRPEEDTPLKNGESEVEGKGGERRINLPDWVCEILNTYIDGTGDPNDPKRKEKKDDYDRDPLFTTKHGRVSESTLRRDLYKITQPCRHGRDCPHDMDPDTCDARNDNDYLSRCLSNVSPHPVRRGGICHQLKQGVPKDVICERADVSRKVLDKHYDLRTKEEARQQRREELRKHLEGYDGDSDVTSIGGRLNKTAHLLRQKSPLLTDDSEVINKPIDAFDRVSIQDRIVKGFIGYAAFVTLTGVNLGLTGIGFDPVTWELIVDL